jgi:hypothetical protein
MKPKLLLCLALVYSTFLFIYQPSPVEKLSGAAMECNLEGLKKLEAKWVSLDSQNVHVHKTEALPYLLLGNTV